MKAKFRYSQNEVKCDKSNKENSERVKCEEKITLETSFVWLVNFGANL